MKQIDKLKDAATSPLKYGIGCTSNARQSIKDLLTTGKAYTGKSGYSKGWKTKRDWTDEVTKILNQLKITFIVGNDSPRGGLNSKFVQLTGKQLIKDIQK